MSGWLRLGCKQTEAFGLGHDRDRQVRAHPLGQPSFPVPAHVAAADRLERESALEGGRQGQSGRGAVDVTAEMVATDPAYLQAVIVPGLAAVAAPAKK